MDNPIIKEPTQVNARELWLNSSITFTSIAFEPYVKYDPTNTTIPDGEYFLEFLPDDPRSTKNKPFFYLFNSDEKWTGIIMYLQFTKNGNLINFNLPKDLKDKKYKVFSKKGKFEISTPPNQEIKTSYSEQLTSFFSRKLQKFVQFNKYPLYIPTQNEISQTTGTIVSGDTNQPIKGATIEKTD
jgi:hypothetical protein